MHTGAEEFGDPCRQCGFDWAISPENVARLHAGVHDALEGINPTQFAMTSPQMNWSVGQYVCHIGDNERIWAERFAGALADPASIGIAPFDQDRLAVARNYGLITHAAAMWSLHRAYDDWTTTSTEALGIDVTLHHPERGTLSVLDAIRTVVHDCHHHLWDIRNILDC